DSIDVDGDGLIDGCDPLVDSDGDSIADNLDQCEGFDDSIDVDGDGLIDGCDDLIDNDGDGVSNSEDAFPNDANETLDSDGDGVGDNQQLAAELQAEEDAKQQMMIISGVVLVIIVVAVGTFFVLKKKDGSDEMPKQSPIMNFNNPHMQQTVVTAPTVVNQWTDQAGYTWRTMSDGSTLWWNGREWQKT
ncbi:MAG: hypothetical protein CMA03_04350, partial [Euryarchaeota archaeon]|nr:hypothetical protein [Euryarchaeota archaeon]